jgi:hypothetical protein
MIRDAPIAAVREVHAFVDPALSRSRPDWGELRIPEGLRTLADETWELVSTLGAGAAADDVSARLDEVRSEYVQLYEEAEAIAQASVAAARMRVVGPAASGSLPLRVARRIPRRYRQRLPLRWRVRVARVLRGSRGSESSPQRALGSGSSEHHLVSGAGAR